MELACVLLLIFWGNIPQLPQACQGLITGALSMMDGPKDQVALPVATNIKAILKILIGFGLKQVASYLPRRQRNIIKQQHSWH